MNEEKLIQIISILEKMEKKSGYDYTHAIRFAIVEGIDNAINGHRGTMDGVDIDRMRADRRNEEALQSQINSLAKQATESRVQTAEIKRQTWYIILAFTVTLIASIVSIIFSTISYQLLK